jgi:MinD superfamily P-loop ATPase
MTIAIASGKGGAGKTAVATAMSLSVPGPVQLIDCDVEEPDAALFLIGGSSPSDSGKSVPVTLMVPEEIPGLCNGCGECAKICRFHAIVPVKNTVMVFPELCHACGGCVLVCPVGALAEGVRTIGTLQRDVFGGAVPLESRELITGELSIGQPLAPPLIRAARKGADPQALVLIDAPPGTSCSFVAAVRGVDLVLLVAEPTPFGLHDLSLTVEALRMLKLPFALIINKSAGNDSLLTCWADKEGVKVIVSLPDEPELAEGLSKGKSMVEVYPAWKPLFRMILEKAGRLLC